MLAVFYTDIKLNISYVIIILKSEEAFELLRLS